MRNAPPPILALLFIFLTTLPVLYGQEAPAVSKLDPAMGTNKAATDNLDWHDVRKWGVEGRILPSQERLRWFDRLPHRLRRRSLPTFGI